MTDVYAVIPARFASTRLPGKPLRLLAGHTMLEHVWRNARRSQAVDVIIATDDDGICQTASAFGAEVMLTRSDHTTGSDRIAEVAATKNWPDAAIVVNVQCDEPMLPPELIDQVANLLQNGADIATLATTLHDDDDIANPNVVKVVVDQNGKALYFSRAAIPFHRDQPDSHAGTLRHIGLYAYRVGALRRLCAMPPCELEMIERLEQLRALWAGMRIDVAIAAAQPGPGVDTQADWARVDALMSAIAEK